MSGGRPESNPEPHGWYSIALTTRACGWSRGKFTRIPLSSVVTSLPTDQEVSVRFPALPWDFCLVENYHKICTDWVFQCHIQFMSEEALHSADHRSGKSHELCTCFNT